MNVVRERNLAVPSGNIQGVLGKRRPRNQAFQLGNKFSPPLYADPKMEGARCPVRVVEIEWNDSRFIKALKERGQNRGRVIHVFQKDRLVQESDAGQSKQSEDSFCLLREFHRMVEVTHQREMKAPVFSQNVEKRRRESTRQSHRHPGMNPDCLDVRDFGYPFKKFIQRGI